ncbi:MAG: division/cell wall cluster transcriptional repressor MraZ [Treponema sp.]|jgi:MraZ protein|nr:division/cell wall cluster transcriptional repressor MraZ [Treponema sp.]
MLLQTGTFESTLDDKGRVVIPAPLRERYNGELLIMQGKELCVWVMTPAGFEHFIETFEKESVENELSAKEIDAFEYQHISTKCSVDMDPKTGRIPIQAILRNYASLTKDCLVLSIKGRLEIWNAKEYKSFMEEVRQINKITHEKMHGKVNFFLEEKA